MVDLPAGADPKTLVVNDRASPKLPAGADPSTVVQNSGSDGGGFDPLAAFGEVQQPPIVGQTLKDIGLGAASAATGAGELIPGVQPYAAKGSEWIKRNITSPVAGDAGYAIPFLAGGDVLGAGKLAGSLIPKAAEGAGMLTRAALGSSRGVLSGAATGAEMGAEAGLVEPTGDPDYASSLKKHGELAGIRGAEGAIVGGGLGLAGKAAQGVGTLAKTAFGKEAQAGAEALRKAATERSSGVVSEETAKSEAALKKAADIQVRLDQETERLDAAKGSAGDAQEHADRLLKELQDKKNMTTAQFGDRVRQLAKDTYEKYRRIREVESGYAAAVEAASEDPIVNTKPIRDLLKEWKIDATSGADKSVISYLEDEIGTLEKKSSTEGAKSLEDVFASKSKPKVLDAISVKKADSLRKSLDSLYHTKDLRVIGKSEGSAATSQFKIGRALTMLKQAISQADPRLAEATRKFREWSEPLDFLERKGPLAGALRKDVMGRDYLMERSRVVEGLLSKTKQGNQAFTRLIKEDPELKEDARKFFQNRLFGEAGLEKPITPQSADKFLRDNKDALEQTGLFDEFASIRDKLTKSADSVKQMRVEAAARQENVKVLQNAFADEEKAGKISDKISGHFKELSEALDRGNLEPKDIATRAENAFNSLHKEGKINDDEWKSLLRDVDKLRSTVQSTEATRRFIKRAIMALVITAAGYPVARDLHITTHLF